MLPPAAEEIAPGDVVGGKYRFDRLLGEGGQGWVWQAQNLALDIPVAIKVVRTEGGDKSLPERLFREARAAAQLGHPAIVRVFDLGQAENGSPFIVMELLEGENLADRLVQCGRLSPELSIRLLLPIADALLAAHAKSIVHRDVKPDNVFLAVSGDTLQPKLLDFGIAKVQKTPSRARQITQSGAIVGSPAYLSPEQAQGLTSDERADVWSFCATLYECMTGELPFEGATWRVLRRNIVETPPESILDLGVGDAELWSILKRGLAKEKDSRWPSMLALGQALARWLLANGVSSDICGVSLESRWLRCEPLAVGLFPVKPRDTAGPTLLSSLGALPTEGSDVAPISRIPIPGPALSPRQRSRVREASDDESRTPALRGRNTRAIVFGFAGALLLALAGVGVAQSRDQARGTIHAASPAPIPAQPATRDTAPALEPSAPIVTPMPAAAILTATTTDTELPPLAVDPEPEQSPEPAARRPSVAPAPRSTARLIRPSFTPRRNTSSTTEELDLLDPY